jgi:NDP-sugar pyrophosphorylase family protein
MKAVILAGGRGTRLAPYTTVLPKPLMPVGERPILEIILRQLRHFQFNEVTLACGFLMELIRAYVSSSPLAADLKINYFTESKPLGTAGALRCIAGLNETFLAMNGDVLTTLDYADVVQFHRRQQAALTVVTSDKKFPIQLGIVRIEDDSRVVGYDEKPTFCFPVSTGVYVYEPRVLEFIQPDVYLDLPTLVLRLLEAGERVVAYRMQGFWLDIGNRDDFEAAAAAVQEHRDSLHLGDD